jgi:hypothetical protein
LAGDKPIESADKKFSLQVFEDTPATAPPKKEIAALKDFCAYFIVTLKKEGTHIESFGQAEEIQQIDYVLTMETVEGTYLYRLPFKQKLTCLLASFKKDESATTSDRVVFTLKQKKEDKQIKTKIIPKYMIGIPCQFSATLEVTVTLQTGNILKDFHKMEFTVSQYTASVYILNGKITKNRYDEWIWNMAELERRIAQGKKLTPWDIRSVIGHAAWNISTTDAEFNKIKADISPESSAITIKNDILSKKFGFSGADSYEWNAAIEKARTTGNFSVSVQGILKQDKGMGLFGTFGLTKEGFISGLQFILDNNGDKDGNSKKHKYGNTHNCVDMAIEGLNKAKISHSRFKESKTDIRIFYHTLKGEFKDNGKVTLSLPSRFGNIIKELTVPNSQPSKEK